MCAHHTGNRAIRYLLAVLFVVATVAMAGCVHRVKDDRPRARVKEPAAPAHSPAADQQRQPKSNGEHAKQIWDAVVAGQTGEVEKLLQQGADPNTRDPVIMTFYGFGSDDTLLHRSVRLSGPDDSAYAMTKLLLEHGADPNATDPDGSTPLHDALRHSAAPELLCLLVEHGADPNITYKDRFIPLIEASRRSPHQYEVLKCFLEHGGNVNVSDAYGKTPLHHFIIRWGMPEYVKKIGRHKPRPPVSREPTGPPKEPTLDEFPLSKATVELLLDHGADINATDNKGQTPLDLTEHHPTSAEFLKSRGAVHGTGYQKSDSSTS